MSAREKAKAKAETRKKEEEEFFERTGIRDESEDFNIDNLMNSYEFESAKHRHKSLKEFKKAFR